MSGKLPAGALMTCTELGNSGYLGPCPPPGDHPHRYLFTVFAVGKDKLGVTADTSPAVVGSTCISIRWRRRRSWGCSRGEGGAGRRRQADLRRVVHSGERAGSP